MINKKGTLKNLNLFMIISLLFFRFNFFTLEIFVLFLFSKNKLFLLNFFESSFPTYIPNYLIGRTLNRSTVDIVDNIMWRATINCTTNTVSGSQNFLTRSGQFPSH